jgi:hypothetical protein
MTESDNIPAAERVTSAITKHIKIYSDNPMHDAIDRIIDSCTRIDESEDYYQSAYLDLQQAADELLSLTIYRMTAAERKHDRDMYG